MAEPGATPALGSDVVDAGGLDVPDGVPAAGAVALTCAVAELPAGGGGATRAEDAIAGVLRVSAVAVRAGGRDLASAPPSPDLPQPAPARTRIAIAHAASAASAGLLGERTWRA